MIEDAKPEVEESKRERQRGKLDVDVPSGNLLFASSGLIK